MYLIPTVYNFKETDLPQHPCLRLKEICHQPLSSRHGRRAVVMVKYREYDDASREIFQQYKLNVMEGKVTLFLEVRRLITNLLDCQDDGFGQLLRKLTVALSSDAFENELVTM